VGVVTGSSPTVLAQITKLHLPVLLDSGSVRSLISFQHFRELSRTGLELSRLSKEITCVTALGQSIQIIGEVKVSLKIQGFSWPWTFLVSKRLRGPPILGADFLLRPTWYLTWEVRGVTFGLHTRSTLISS
jgi:hypothetical protein